MNTTIFRWQDWGSVGLGAALAGSPWLAGYVLDDKAATNACGIGVVLVVFNLISAARLIDAGQELFNILLGGWLVLSPYSLGFAADRPAEAFAMMTGAAVISLAFWQIHDQIDWASTHSSNSIRNQAVGTFTEVVPDQTGIP